jgi:hypothetical protein
MKLTAFILHLSFCKVAIPSDLINMRAEFEKASNNEQLANTFLFKLNQLPNLSLVQQGYKGAITMVSAKFAFNPFAKFDLFNTGKTILTNALLKDNNNIELRFIRFSIQSNTPSFLQYNQYINSDKQFLLNQLLGLKDIDLKKRITKFLKASPYLSDNERSILNQH